MNDMSSFQNPLAFHSNGEERDSRLMDYDNPQQMKGSITPELIINQTYYIPMTAPYVSELKIAKNQC